MGQEVSIRHGSEGGRYGGRRCAGAPEDPDYNTGEIEFTVTGGTINGNVTAGAGAEVALEGGSDLPAALGTIADSGKLVVSGGSYAQSPAKYLAADAAAAGIGKQGGSATYYVGTPAQIEQRVEKAAAGDAVEVLQGDLNVTLPDGVAVINSGSGEVIVNDQPVTGEGVVTHTHKAVKVEAKDATETEAGNIAYWYCGGCGKYFADEALTKGDHKGRYRSSRPRARQPSSPRPPRA